MPWNTARRLPMNAAILALTLGPAGAGVGSATGPRRRDTRLRPDARLKPAGHGSRRRWGDPAGTYSVPAIAAQVPERPALLNNPRVTTIEPDGEVHAVGSCQEELA